MTIAANIAVALVAVLHPYFIALETSFSHKPRRRRALGPTPEFAKA